MRDGGGWTFRRLAFDPHYDAEAVAEFPGDGNWPCPEFCFEHDGSVVAVDGAAYLPEAGALLLHEQVNQVVPVAGMPLLLLAGSTDIVAVGPQGIAWRSPRLGMDDLRVLDANQRGIRCSVAAHGGHPVPIVLHPALGQ